MFSSTASICVTASTSVPYDIHELARATTAGATPAELAETYRQALQDSDGDGVVAVHHFGGVVEHVQLGRCRRPASSGLRCGWSTRGRWRWVSGSSR